MKKLLLFLTLFIQTTLFAQSNNQYGKSFTFNLNTFKSNASRAIQANGLAGKMSARFSLPDGKTENFVFDETLITTKKLATVQTYDAVSEDGKKIMKLTIIGDKLEGIMHTPEGYFYIETIDAKQNLYRIYSHEELPKDKNTINCGATDEDFKPKKNGRILSVAPFPYGTQLKRFTAAIVVTKEMTNLYTSQDLALAQVVSIANANNLIYELEAAMTFVLAPQTTDKTIIFTNANPGPTEFETINVPNCQAGFTALNTSNILPYSVYGIGHTFNTLPAIQNGSSGNGVAGPTPCVDDSKSRGFTQWSLGSPLSLIINIFTHELGHQFAAPHTYNAIGGTNNNNTFCLNGWSSTSAIEPGSGTTMMSYANNCVNPTNYTLSGNNKLQYFNTKSLEFIRNAIASTSGSCATNVALTNTPPIANAGTAITIPKGTPFTLKGTGTDANNDVLTYTWEQYDVAAEADKGLLGSTAVNSTTAPLFRSEQSSTTTSRDFPRIANILTNANTPPDAAGEALPQVARTMKFRFTVRDNKTGGGGVDSDEVTVTVNTTGPFALTSFNTAQTIAAGSNQTITWDVNNTNTLSANVKILLSIDEGASFSFQLAASVPNNGSATLTIPANVPNTTLARIKIVSTHSTTGSFFDINNANITITSSCLANTTFICPENTVSGASGNPVFNLGLGYVTGSKFTNNSRSFPTAGAVQRPLINYIDNTYAACQISSWGNAASTLVTFRVSKTGTYAVSASGDNGAGTQPYTIFSTNNFTDCSNFVNANSHSAIGATGSRNVTLNECTTYYVLLYSGIFGAANNITLSIQGTGDVIEVLANPAGFDYTYIAINQANDQIAGVSATANFTTLAGGQYTVYGLTYTTGLNTNDLLNKTLSEAYGLGNCMLQSQNTKSLIITSSGIPCPTTLTLVNPTDNVATGTVNLQAANTVTASNKITGTAKVDLRAGKSIELKPSTTGGGSTFEAANGTVFQAYIQGCAN
jgi:Metallo-peptidase family M12